MALTTSRGLNLGGRTTPSAGGPVTLSWQDLYRSLSTFDGLPPTDPETVRSWESLLSAVTALVDRYAPLAPTAIKNEATLRAAGYLVVQPMAAVSVDSESRESQGGSKWTNEVSFMPARQSALRHSGSMALLSPWKIRRAL